MELGPDLRAGLKDQEADRLAAIAESQHEQAHAAILAAVRIADHGAGAVIDLGLLARRGLDHSAGFLGGLAEQFAHEALDTLIAAGEAAGVDQILPDRHGVAAAGEPQFDSVPMHRARTGATVTSSGARYAKVGDHRYGRFCVGRRAVAAASRRVISASGVRRSGAPAPKSVVTAMAGFAEAARAVSVQCLRPTPPRASLRRRPLSNQADAVSRRTPVVFSNAAATTIPVVPAR